MCENILQKHSRQIAGKQQPLTHLKHISIETEKKTKKKLTEFFPNFEKCSNSVCNVLDSKIIVNSASKMKAIKFNNNSSKQSL